MNSRIRFWKTDISQFYGISVGTVSCRLNYNDTLNLINFIVWIYWIVGVFVGAVCISPSTEVCLLATASLFEVCTGLNFKALPVEFSARSSPVISCIARPSPESPIDVGPGPITSSRWICNFNTSAYTQHCYFSDDNWRSSACGWLMYVFGPSIIVVKCSYLDLKFRIWIGN